MASDQDNNSVSVTDGEDTFVAFTKRPAIPLVERAYNVIAELCDKAGGPVWFSQQSLAGYLHVSGPRLSLAINQLKEDRRITVTREGNYYSYMTTAAGAQMPLVAAISAPREPAKTAQPETSRRRRPRKAQVKHAVSTTEGSDDAGKTQVKPPESASEELGDCGVIAQQTTDNEAETREPNGKSGEGGARSVWDAALEQISMEIPREHFGTFFTPTVGVSLSAAEITVATQSDYANTWLNMPLHYDIAKDAVKVIAGQEMEILYVVNHETAKTSQSRTAPHEPSNAELRELTDCTACGPGTMVLTTWEGLKRQAGESYYCKEGGKCSRLWNSVVGEFYPPGQPQLGYREATEALKRALLTANRSARNYGQSPRARAPARSPG